jgi:hypothetical protein
MRQTIAVELFGDQGNFATVRLPDRSSAGVVFQLDSLERITSDLSGVLELLRNGDAEEALAELEAVHSELDEIHAYSRRMIDQG